MRARTDRSSYRLVKSPTGVAEWWTRGWLLTLVVAASVIPLIGPPIAPLIDLPGHMAFYHVELHAADIPTLARVYRWHWSLVGNLGAELLVWPLGHLLGLEPAVKLIVMAIPLLTVTGLLIVAHETHGRVPPTAFFALPLAYSYPFQYGFINYALSTGLMLVALGLWMRLGRLGRRRMRAAIFVPGTAALFVTHSVGWAMTGLAIGAVELVAARQAGTRWPRAIRAAAIACAPLLPSVLMLLTWLGAAPGDVSDGFGLWWPKLLYAAGIVWNGWDRLDLETTLILYGLLLTALLGVRLRVDPRPGLAAALLGLLYLAMPQRAIGSCYADMRIIPFALALALVAIGPLPSLDARKRSLLAVAGIGLWAVRLAAQAETYDAIEREQAVYLPAIDRLPDGARVFSIAGNGCDSRTMWARLDHLSNLAVVRRNAFVNGIWPTASGQLLQLRDPRDARLFWTQSSQYRTSTCPDRHSAMPAALADFRSGGFDYLWMIDMPPSLWPHDRTLVPIWQSSRGILFRVSH